MIDKKPIIIIFIGFILIVSIVGAASFVLVGPGGELISNDRTPKYWYECNVNIKEKLIGTQAYIESATCSNTGKKCGYLFSFFAAEGVVQVWDSTGKIAAKDFETGLLSGEDTITLRACSSGANMKLKLYNDEQNLLDEKKIA